MEGIRKEVGAKEVRIYLCSSSTDMLVEKQTLHVSALRQLRNSFREEGVEFQVIDLRHGIPLDPVRYFVEESIYLKEIARTRRRSAAVNFIALLGHKYEPCLVPREITKDAYRFLTTHLEEEERSYVSKYYHRDNNNIPASYVLSPEPQILTLSMEDMWVGFETVRLFLKKGLNAAHAEGQIPSTWACNIFESNLFREVEGGLRGNSHNAVVIKRTCYNTENVNNQTLHRFFDMLEEDNIIVRNDEYKQLVQNFRNILLPRLKPDKKIYDLSPHSLPITTLSKCEEQARYLRELDSILVNEITPSAIFASMSDSEVYGDNYCVEQETQHPFDTELSIEYLELVDRVQQKLPQSQRPFVITGPCGCGKTELLEHLYKRSKEVFDIDNSLVIWRSFIPQVEDGCIVDLLAGLLLNVMEVQNIDDDIPSKHDVFLLSEKLRMLLSKTYVKPVAILMDGLENIPKTHNSHSLRWLPSLLGRNVHLILTISSGTDVGDLMLENARKWIGDSARIFTVPSFSQVAASELILQQLAVTSRSLRSDQFDAIFRAFHQSSNPLLLRMALRESRSWHSFTTQDDMVVKTSIIEGIKLLCRRSENETKVEVVKTALGSLCVSRYGLSEAEIKEALTLEDTVIALLWKEGSYPAQKSVYPFKIPDIYWHRIFYIMEPYLLETPRQGCVLLSWRHQIIHDVIKDRYIPDKKDDFHFSLADYFAGRWSDKTKQISIDGVPYHVDCLVPPQPWIWPNNTLNVRKFAEYPYHLTRCGKSEELVKLLLDSIWILKMTHHAGLCQIIETMTQFRDQVHAAVFRDVVGELKHILQHSKTTHHLLSGLLSKFGSQHTEHGYNGSRRDGSNSVPLILIDSARQLNIYQEPALIPINSSFEDCKIYKGTITGMNIEYKYALSKSGAIFAAANRNRVTIYNLSGETETWFPIKEYYMPRENETILDVQLDDCGIYLSVLSSVPNGDSGKNIARLYEIKYHHCAFTEDNVVLATLDNTGKLFIIGQTNGGIIVSTDDKKRKYTICYPDQSGRLEQLVTSSDGHIIAQFKIGKLVVYGCNGKLQSAHRILYHGYGGASMQTVGSVGKTWQWGLTKDHLVWYTAPKGYQLYVVSLSDDTPKTHKYIEKSIDDLFCDYNSNCFVISCKVQNKRFIQVWDAALNKLSHTVEDLEVQTMDFLKTRQFLVLNESIMSVWSLDKGQTMCSFSLCDRENGVPPPCLHVTTAEDKQLALVDSGHSISVFNLTVTLNIVGKSWTRKEDVGTCSTCMVISELSFCTVVGTSSGQIWQVDLVSGENRRHITAHSGPVSAIACSDPVLASSSLGEVCLWGLPELEAISQFSRKALMVVKLGFTSDASILVCITRKEIITLDIQTMTPKVLASTSFGPYDLVKASTDWSAVVGGDIQTGAGYVSFYNTQTTKLGRSPAPPGDAIQCLAFSPASKYAVVAFSCSPTENPTSNCLRIYDTKSTDSNFGRYLEGRSMEYPTKSMTMTTRILLSLDESNKVTIFKNLSSKLHVIASFKLEGPPIAILGPTSIDIVTAISKCERQTRYTLVCGKTGSLLYGESLPLRQPILDVMMTKDARYTVFLYKDGISPMVGILKKNHKLNEITTDEEHKVQSRACIIL